MIWRLLEFIILFAVFFLFIVLNLENKCDINFGFTKHEAVPVFLTVFSSFFIGMLCTLPFIFASKRRKKAKIAHEKGLLAKASKKQGKDSASVTADSGLFDKTHYGID
ncbi:MAG: hypothetical protein LBB89_12180 [Treponema sp.]|nr:hypothetical protein [Treponema sp.]